MKHRSRLAAHEPSRTAPDSAERRALRFVHRDPGAPLASGTRARMETRLAHNFAAIRVHDGSGASRASRDLGARAFTVGQDIVFGEGALAPSTAEGERLLAHELTHAVQNARARPGLDMPLVSAGHESGEVEARTVAAHVAVGETTAGVQAAPAAVIARSPNASEDDSGFLGNMSDWFGIGESTMQGLAENEWAKDVPHVGNLLGNLEGVNKLGTVSDVFGVLSGGQGIYGGFKSLVNGGGWGAAADTGKSLLDTVSSVGGVVGSGPVEGYTGIASGGIDVGRGLYDAIESDDLDVATKGAQTAAGGFADMITGAGDATGNPWLMGGGRALGAGMKAGEHIVNWTDAGAKRRGDFGQNEFGENRTGSEAAADTGRAVEDTLNDYIPDWMASVAGGGAAIGTSWYNAGASAVNHVRENVTLDPDEIDWGKTVRPWNWFD